MKKRLSPDLIEAISSTYLREGRRQEAWVIRQIEIDDDRLFANVAMTSVYVPAGGQFHLTVFSTLEFASQLMIVYAHDWAGLDAKVREGWMVETHMRTVRAISSADDIRVNMHIRKIRRRGANLYCEADFTVSDASSGLFELSLKGFLS